MKLLPTLRGRELVVNLLQRVLDANVVSELRSGSRLIRCPSRLRLLLVLHKGRIAEHTALTIAAHDPDVFVICHRKHGPAPLLCALMRLTL